MEMLEHSNRRSRLSFFNIEMMETLRHRESTRDGRRGDCPRGRRAGPEAAVLLSGGNRLREKLGGSEQWKAGDRGKRRLRGDGAEGPPPEGGCRSLCLYIGSWMRATSHAGRGEAPGRCRPSARIPAIRPRSAALELSASCVRAGFPPAPRRGRV